MNENIIIKLKKIKIEKVKNISAFMNAVIFIFTVLSSWYRIIRSFYTAASLLEMYDSLSSMVLFDSFQNIRDGLTRREEMFCQAPMVGAITLTNVVQCCFPLQKHLYFISILIFFYCYFL